MVTGVNWRMFLTTALLLVSLYLIIMYRDATDATDDLKTANLQKRRAGAVLLLATVVVAGYYYYTGAIKFRANMPNDCKVCNLYIKRHRGLRPYKADEIKMLAKHADSCNACSKMCTDEVNILKKYQDIRPNEFKRVKDSCVETTKYAILSRKELDRLKSQLQGKGVGLWKGAKEMGIEPRIDPFPKIPE